MAKQTIDVLIVLTTAERRGAETQGRNLGLELARRGLSARVVALQPTQNGDGLDVELLGVRRFSAATLLSLRRLARRSAVVVAFGSSSLPACSIAMLGIGTPLIYRSIGNPEDWIRGPGHRWRTSLLFRRVSHVAALWAGASDSIGRMYSVPALRRTVIPNFRSAAEFSAGTADDRLGARRSLRLEDDAVVIAFVGALSHEKNPEAAVRAVSLVPDAVLVIAGDGAGRVALERLAQELLCDRAKLLGSITHVRDIYLAADALLLTSRTEGMPGVLIEAGLCGLPAVSTDVGAASEVVRDGITGRLVSRNADDRELAAALIDVLEHRVSYGRNASQWTRQLFETAVVVERWVQLLRVTSATKPRGIDVVKFD